MDNKESSMNWNTISGKFLSTSSPISKVQTSVLGLGVDFVFSLSQEQEEQEEQQQEEQEEEPPPKSIRRGCTRSLIFDI